MSTINLEEIIKNSQVDEKFLSEQLFPGNAYPMLALKRVKKGEANLDSSQIVKLSELTGISIENLFEKEGWKSSSNPSGLLIFENGDFRAELNRTDWTTKIYHKGSLFEDMLIHDKNTLLSTFLEKIEEIISKHNF